MVASSGCGDEFTSGPTGGSGGGGTTSATGTDTSTGGEDCQNGDDDDGDALVDCADPDCTDEGYQCFATPSEWEAPVVPVAGDASTCPAGFLLDQWQGGSVVKEPTAACGPCPACDSSPSHGCSPNLATEVFPQAGCPGSGTLDTASATTCNSAIEAASLLLQPPAVTGLESCGTSHPPPTSPCAWDDGVQRCSVSSSVAGGCDEAATCTPPVTAGAEVCWYRTGHHPSCPQQDVSPLHLFADIADERDCVCDCTAACDLLVDVWHDGTCAGPPVASYAADGACHDSAVSPAPTVSVQGQASPEPVCRQEPPRLEGNCAPDGPVALCCHTVP